MTRERLRVGISPCPNDTFAFHGLLERRIDSGFELDFELADIESLNERWLAGEFDVAKVSFAAALHATDALVLTAGAAVGRGVGPVVLARYGVPAPDAAGTRVLAPGELTTATLLWRIFHPAAAPLRQVVFSAIPGKLERGEADLGVCIHEARFTYRERGLRLVEDLGERWESATGLPLPLGGLLARRSLGPERASRFAAAVRASIEHARASPDAALATMRRHAQEHLDEVLRQHVELYVTSDTLRLGSQAQEALAELALRAVAAGAAPAGASLAVAEGTVPGSTSTGSPRTLGPR
jgi:1,4-dihydroxy-6-naphthoate synthase